MDISESILKDHLISKDYDMPRIEISNYYLKWNDESYGIDQKETPELKRFLANVIPFFDTSYELLNNLKPKQKDKYRLLRELAPHIRISHRNKDHHRVSYDLHMHPDGSTFIDRIEGIETTKNNEDIVIKKANVQRHHVKPILYLKWNLGELLFNRQGGI